MNFTVFGIIWLILLFISLFKGIKWSLSLLIISCVFQSTALINTDSKGFSIFLFTELFFIIKYFKLIFRDIHKFIIPLNFFKYIFIFLIFSILGGVILPNIFEGIKVFVPELGIDENYYIGGKPLFFSSGNIVQMIYLSLNILTLYLLFFLRSRYLYFFSIKMFIFSILIVVFLGFWEFLSKQFGIYYPTDFISNNAGYALLNDMVYLDQKKIVSTFIEASFTGGFLAAAFWAIFYIKTLWAKIFSFFIFMALTFNLSGTGFATFFIGGVILLILNKKFTYVFWILILTLILTYILIYSGYYDIIKELLITKSSSDSGINRQGSNDFSLKIFYETYGFGVGLGSHRASSFLFTIIACSGIASIFLFIYLFKIIKLTYKEIFKDNNFIYSGVVFRFGLVYLIAQILAIPDISNPTFWSWQFIALLYIDNNNLNKKK